MSCSKPDVGTYLPMRVQKIIYEIQTSTQLSMTKYQADVD